MDQAPPSGGAAEDGSNEDPSPPQVPRSKKWTPAQDLTESAQAERRGQQTAWKRVRRAQRNLEAQFGGQADLEPSSTSDDHDAPPSPLEPPVGTDQEAQGQVPGGVGTGPSTLSEQPGHSRNTPPTEHRRQAGHGRDETVTRQAERVEAEPNEANSVRQPQPNQTDAERMKVHRARKRQAKHPKKTMTAAERKRKSRDNQQPANPQPPTSSSSAAASPAPAPSVESTADVTPVPGNHTTLHGTHPHRPVVTHSNPPPNANESAAQPAVRRADAVATASRLASDVPTPAVGGALPAATSRVRMDVRLEAGVRAPSHSPLRQTNLAHERGARDPSHSPIRPTNLAHEETYAELDAAPVSSPVPVPTTADADVALPLFRGIRNHSALPSCAPSVVQLIYAAGPFIEELKHGNGPVTKALVDIARELDQESTVPVDLSRLGQAITARIPDFALRHADPCRFFRKVREMIDDELLAENHARPLPTEMFDMTVAVDRKCRCGTGRYARTSFDARHPTRLADSRGISLLYCRWQIDEAHQVLCTPHFPCGLQQGPNSESAGTRLCALPRLSEGGQVGGILGHQSVRSRAAYVQSSLPAVPSRCLTSVPDLALCC
jgi:hypothetical protein